MKTWERGPNGEISFRRDFNVSSAPLTSKRLQPQALSRRQAVPWRRIRAGARADPHDRAGLRTSELHADPREQRRERDPRDDVRKMSLPVVAEQVMPQHRPGLGVEVREEVEPGVAEQEPVKEADIERLESQKHDRESPKELPEAEAVSDAVPGAQYQRAAHEDEGERDHPPAHGVLAGEALGFCLGHNIVCLFRRRGKESLLLDESDAAEQHQEKPGHHHDREQDCEQHGDHLLIYNGLSERGPQNAVQQALLRLIRIY